MTKADIVNEISKDLGLEKRLVLEVVEALWRMFVTLLSRITLFTFVVSVASSQRSVQQR